MPMGFEHHRKSGFVGGNGGGAERIVLTSVTTAIGLLSVSATTTEVKAGGTRLAGRKQIFIFNDSVVDMYISFSTPITPATGDSILIESGTDMVIDVDPLVNEPLYIRTDTATVNIRIMEVQ